MLLPLPDDGHPAADRDAATLIERLSRVQRPGGRARGSRGATERRAWSGSLCAAAELPLLLDADALHALAAARPAGDPRRPRPPS